MGLWAVERGFKVSSGTVYWNSSSYGTDFDSSEMASLVLLLSSWPLTTWTAAISRVESVPDVSMIIDVPLIGLLEIPQNLLLELFLDCKDESAYMRPCPSFSLSCTAV